MTTASLAFDRASVRTYDQDGRLHVALTNISKAAVNPYRGNEIPGWEELGLEPTRVYQLLRCPEELKAAAPTFNNLPILDRHIPVSAEAPEQDSVVGSTGTDGDFSEPYLKNSAVIWVASAIELIESEKRKEWSCAYHYVADMTPGTYKGLRYDGIMRKLRGNHVALVEEGRAGADCVVGDSKLGTPQMALKSRKALLVKGALGAYLAPKLAQDAKIDLTPILADVTRGNFGSKAAGIVTAVTTATAGKLAQDADLADLAAVIDTFKGGDMEDGAADEDEIDDENDPPPAVDGDDVASKVMAFLKGKISDEDLAQIATLCGGPAEDQDMDVNDPKDGQEGPKTAMDAKSIEDRAVKRVAAAAQARADVEPVVGKVAMALDAAAVYGLAFDHLKIEYKGIPSVAYPAMFKLAMDAKNTTPKLIAQDAADGGAADRFSKQFPDAAPLSRS